MTFDQPLNLHLRRAVIGLVNQVAYHIILAGIEPVGLRFRFAIRQKVVAVVNDIPRAVHLLFSEPIAIIPLLDFVMMSLQSVVVQNRPDFAIRKTEVLIELRVCNRMHLEVVEPCEDALLRNSQATRHDREVEAVVRL